MNADHGYDRPLPVDRLVRGLVLMIGLVVFGDLVTLAIRTTGHDHAKGLIPFLDVAEEGNLPTFVAGLLWIWTGMAMVVLSRYRAAGVVRWAWTGWATIAGYMAFDELFSVHEQWKVTGTQLSQSLFGSVPYFAWIVVAILPVIGVGLFSLAVFRRLDTALRLRLFLAGVCFVTGALGLEFVQGEWARVHGRDLVFHAIVLLEELLEMTAVLLALRACLLELRRLEFRVRLG